MSFHSLLYSCHYMVLYTTVFSLYRLIDYRTGTVYQTKSLCCPSKNFVCSQPRDVGVRCSSTRYNHSFLLPLSIRVILSTIQLFVHSEFLVGISMLIRRRALHSSTMDVKVIDIPSLLTVTPFLTGNRNNFATQKACQNYCLSEACPPGTVVAKEADAGRLVSCSNPGTPSLPPPSFSLYLFSLKVDQVVYQVDVLRDIHVIRLLYSIRMSAVEQARSCSVSPFLPPPSPSPLLSLPSSALCPTQSTPFISALSLQPMQCTPNVDGACPGQLPYSTYSIPIIPYLRQFLLLVLDRFILSECLLLLSISRFSRYRM